VTNRAPTTRIDTHHRIAPRLVRQDSGMTYDSELDQLRQLIASLARSARDDEQLLKLEAVLGDALIDLWPDDETDGSDEPAPGDGDRHVAIFVRTDVTVPAHDAQAVEGFQRLIEETPLIDVEKILDAHLLITSDVCFFQDVDSPLDPDDLDPFAPTREPL
jgi:hypothetical protein